MSAEKVRRPGDRLVVALGALVGTAVVALVGFSVMVAEGVDRDGARREVTLARGGLAALETKIRHDLSAFAYWDEAVAHTLDKVDTPWLHRNLGQRLHQNEGHDRSYIVQADGQPIYAAIDGLLVLADRYDHVRQQVEPIVREVQNLHAQRASARAWGGEAGGSAARLEPMSRSAYRRIDGRPALVGASTVVPNLNNALLGDRGPVVVVGVSFLDGHFMQGFADDLSIEQVELQDAAPQAPRAGLEIPLPADEQAAWLAWTPRKPGAAMLEQLMQGIVGIAALIVVAAIMVLSHVRRANRQLSDSERRAVELAYRDTLTGLANRERLRETLELWLPPTNAENRMALLFIDLDGFKDINDTLGHAVGDEILAVVGERLERIVGSQALTARFGGDEFALLVPAGKQDGEIADLANRIIENVRKPVQAGEHLLNVGASIGIAIAPEDGRDPEELLRRADIALYGAKGDGRGAWRRFDYAYEQALQKRSSTERELATALAQEALALQFQPLYSADGDRMVGVEALVRWRHPERGLMPPSEFVPVAEHSGLIVKLDEWVLRRACYEALQWPAVTVAVNFSPSNFRQAGLLDRVTRVLSETGFDPRRLEIEITEGMLLGASGDVLGQLAELRRMGVRIALDDFGTGYSSLGYLRRFPVDKIKIDKSFVQNLGITEDAAAIVECVVRLGRALGLAVTAEGVETREQHRFVRAAGCHQVQGFLFSRPVEAAEITAAVEARHYAGARAASA
jgi:diguanylate cyclase (GGDEF)-like protein